MTDCEINVWVNVFGNPEVVLEGPLETIGHLGL
jgi:hypothetical protein